MNTKTSKLTELSDLREYAKMINNLRVQSLVPMLTSDFVYESQMVMEPIKSRSEFLDYMDSKLEMIVKTGSIVFAEMGTIEAYFQLRPCVILAQDDKDNLIGTALAEVEGNELKRIDLCILPSPETAVRSGEYPG